MLETSLKDLASLLEIWSIVEYVVLPSLRKFIFFGGYPLIFLIVSYIVFIGVFLFIFDIYSRQDFRLNIFTLYLCWALSLFHSSSLGRVLFLRYS